MSQGKMTERLGIRPIAIRLVLVLLVAVALTGCGRKGNPQPPPGEKTGYPRTYPSS
jgi:predicted small lipoprotein YifL